MDKYKLLRRLKKELLNLGYAEENLCKFGTDGIGALLQINEETENSSSIRMRWFVDDENCFRIFFLARLEPQKNVVASETEILRFCNAWNQQGVPGTAVYDDKNGLQLCHSMPLPERMSDLFLMYQLYLIPARMTEDFFQEALIKLKWSPGDLKKKHFVSHKKSCLHKN